MNVYTSQKRLCCGQMAAESIADMMIAAVISYLDLPFYVIHDRLKGGAI
jgi:hypothetical protein